MRPRTTGGVFVRFSLPQSRFGEPCTECGRRFWPFCLLQVDHYDDDADCYAYRRRLLLEGLGTLLMLAAGFGAAVMMIVVYAMTRPPLPEPVRPSDGWLVVRSVTAGWWLELRPDEAYVIQQFPPGARAYPLRSSAEDGGGEYFEDVAINYRSDRPAHVYVTREPIDALCERAGIACAKVGR